MSLWQGKTTLERKNMATQSLDTDSKIEAVQIDLIRKASIAERIARMRSLSMTVIQLSRRAIMRANPELSEQECNLFFVSLHYGKEVAKGLEKYLSRRTL